MALCSGVFPQDREDEEEMKNQDKTELFERTAVPAAVRQLIIPTIISSLITIVYNLADTYFVGMLNDPIQNAAVKIGRAHV